MDVQPNQGCFVKLFGDNQTHNISGIQVPALNDKSVNRHNSNLGYLINLEQPDGVSQVLQLNEEQAVSLGIYPNVDANIKPKKVDNVVLQKNIARKDEVIVLKPLGSCENPIEIIKDGELLHSTQNLSPEYLQQIAQALQLNVKREEQKEMENAPPNIFYRVVYPDELNLKPVPVKPLKRGRRRKQPVQEEKDVKEIIEPPKLIRGFRTRSGRVTRPPQHITNDFKKIDTSEGDSFDMNGDLKTIDFESPNVPIISEPVDVSLEDRLETHKRKRSISSQFRCPECKKAYLGNNKMLRHFEKHPDHRPKSDYYKARFDDTWNYLIDTSNKNPAGQRGIKFCKELVNLLNNIRIVAKSFFKNPTDLDKNLFFVDSTLSSVLGIESGNYALNESKLHKEVQVLLPCSTNGQDNNNVKLIADTNFDLSESKDSFTESGDTYNVSNNHETNVNQSNSTIDPLSFNNSSNGFNLNCDMSAKTFLFSEPFQDHNNKEKEIRSLEGNKPELSLHNDLLSENSLLHSLPNLRNSVEELILNNGQDTVMLDNSTSSDEVMNVDQFVNERLKNLTESDLELPNSLNLDLPSLDLFQFHTS